MTGHKSTQLIWIPDKSGVQRPYLAAYTIGTWDDPLGSLEVHTVQRLVRISGRGTITLELVTDPDTLEWAEDALKNTIYTMGMYVPQLEIASP